MSREHEGESLENEGDASKALLLARVNEGIRGSKDVYPGERTESVSGEARGQSSSDSVMEKHVHQSADLPGVANRHHTSYLETLIHLLKGNIGSGMFAMAEAFMHCGILLGPVLTVFLGLICIYNNHTLLRCADFVQSKKKSCEPISFPETMEMSLSHGSKAYSKWTNSMRATVKVFVIITQLGFCCVYIFLVANTLSDVMKYFDTDLHKYYYMLAIYFPILISSLITNLKFLAPVSLVSNVCVIGAVFLTLYVCCKDGLPSISTRNYVASYTDIPLFVGTVIYAFEGIGLILPIRCEMKEPKKFGSRFGVVNVGLAIVMVLLICVGFLGYLRFGEETKSSLSLNVQPNTQLGILVHTIFAIGVCFSYPLQFYVVGDIIWLDIKTKYGPLANPLPKRLMLRAALVTLTFVVTALIPNVGLFISLVGAVCSTALALVFPALMDLSLRTAPVDPMRTPFHGLRLLMDYLTLVVAAIGFTTGSYASIKDIIKSFSE